jgi:hypothetical protein
MTFRVEISLENLHDNSVQGMFIIQRKVSDMSNNILRTTVD